MTKDADTLFAVVSIDGGEIGLLPRTNSSHKEMRQGSPHPDLSEAERRICGPAA